MKQIHTTTSNPMTYVRMSGLLLVSALATFFILPLDGSDLQAFLQTHALNAGLLYAILVGFLLYATLLRKEGLEEAVSLELNKTRRIFHLSLHLQKTEPRLAPWFRELKKSLDRYYAVFRKATFNRYEDGDPLFRKITYSIYSLPSLGIPYNEDLYGSLLDTAASATEAREIIRDKKDAYLGRFSWIVIIVVTVIFCAMVLFATPYDLAPRLISASVIFSLLLVLHLLYEYDRSNVIRHRYFAQLYAENFLESGPRKRF